MSWTRVCRAIQLVVLAYPVYSTRESWVMGLYGSRDHLGCQHSAWRCYDGGATVWCGAAAVAQPGGAVTAAQRCGAKAQAPVRDAARCQWRDPAAAALTTAVSAVAPPGGAVTAALAVA